MDKKYVVRKLLLAAGLSLLLVAPSTEAFARGREETHPVLSRGSDRYHYRDGRFYRQGWFGFEFFVIAPPVGATIRVLPFGGETFFVKGTRYYHHGNAYYTDCPGGYVVVPAPSVHSNTASLFSVAVQPERSSGETVIVSVPNSNGSYTSVTLRRHNNGYLGPQGEYYPGNPSVDQLRALYGK
jgi:hypothetical protein